MATILLAGFLHETNTFSPSPTTLSDFEQPSSGPGLCFGQTIIDKLHKSNTASSGFIMKAQSLGHEIIPAVWAEATPGGIVQKEAFEAVCNMICSAIREHDHLDALYLDLHGAMVTEEYQDGEGELLQRIRNMCHSKWPIIASLDFHANISQDMMDLSDYLDCYRTYPHIDLSDTGARCALVLDQILKREQTLEKELIKLPFLMSLNAQCTLIEPGQSIYQELIKANTDECFVSCAMGFPLADIFDCGPAVLAYSFSKEHNVNAANHLAKYIMACKPSFTLDIMSCTEAVTSAIKQTKQQQKPIIISDTQDNPGAGGSSDTTGLLKELIKQSADNSIVAIMYDPEAAKKAHDIGVDKELLLSLGGKYGTADDEPLQGKFIVTALSSGQFIATGPYYQNLHIDLGPMAVLKTDSVEIIVSTRRMQAADQAIFTHLGIDPKEKSIVVLKSSVHFRADFSDISANIITAQAPGLSTADITSLPYQCIRSDLQLL